MIRRWLTVLLAALALAGCGGGGGSGSGVQATASPTPTPTGTGTPVANTATLLVDGGPAALSIGANGYTALNEGYITITLCAPGSTTNCQTIDHVQVDTGSVGLRVIQGVLQPALLAALTAETDPSGNPVGECYQYVSSYAFGSVRLADFTVAGEKVAAMPVQVVADAGVFATAPASCTSGGGSAITSIQDLGANAIIGIGSTATDCGTRCQTAGSNAGAAYYSCPATGCASIIARTAATTAPFEQLPNPVAAFASDNNGVIIALPQVASSGVASTSGTITFGIGTQSDNLLPSGLTLLALTTSTATRGPALVTANYKGNALSQSFLDTGSSTYYFDDGTITACTTGTWTDFYCPAAPLLLSPTLTGTNNVTASASFTLYNPTTLAATVNVAPGLGVDTALLTQASLSSNSFDFGLPFFFGRTVYSAIEGRDAGGTTGPYVAF